MSDARWLLLAIPLAAAACHSRAAAPTAAPTGEGTLTAASVPAGPVAALAERMPQCPNVVPSATTIVSEVPGGIELRIVAEGDGANEVRRRTAVLVSAADETRGEHQASGALGGRFGRCPVVMRNTKLETREMSGGVAIVLRPSSPSELHWLRREVEARAAQVAAPRPFGSGLLKTCPNAVPSSETTVVERPYGADVKVLASTAEGVRQIRERAHALARRGPAPDDRCPSAIADATLTVSEIRGGASIAIKARRSEDVDALRRAIRERTSTFEPPLRK